jgi:hypothetical protein
MLSGKTQLPNVYIFLQKLNSLPTNIFLQSYVMGNKHSIGHHHNIYPSHNDMHRPSRHGHNHTVGITTNTIEHNNIRRNTHNVRRYNNEISPHDNFYRMSHNRNTQIIGNTFVYGDAVLQEHTQQFTDESPYIHNHNAHVEQLLGITPEIMQFRVIPRNTSVKDNLRCASKSHYISQIEPPTDIQCAICLGDFDDDCVELNCCSHLVHKNCIDDCMKQ